MVQEGATCAVRGPLACLSSRSYSVYGEAAGFRDPSMVGLRSTLVVPTPVSDGYMQEVGLLSAQLGSQGLGGDILGAGGSGGGGGSSSRSRTPSSSSPRTSCDAESTLYSKRAQLLQLEAQGASPDAHAAASCAAEYVDAVRQQPFRRDVVPGQLSEEERACLVVLAQRWRALAARGHPVGVLLIELTTAHTLEGYSYAFLLALRHLCATGGVLLAVDDVMLGMRTGRLLSYMHYPGFYPDLVTFGKAFQVSGMLRVLPRMAEGSGLAVMHGFTATGAFDSFSLAWVGGWLTNGGADRLVAERGLATVQAWLSQQLAGRSLAVGRAVLGRTARLIAESGNRLAFIRGWPLIFFTNAGFNQEAREASLYGRFILPADMDPAVVPKVLTRVHRRGVNAEAAAVRQPPEFPSYSPDRPVPTSGIRDGISSQTAPAGLGACQRGVANCWGAGAGGMGAGSCGMGEDGPADSGLPLGGADAGAAAARGPAVGVLSSQPMVLGNAGKAVAWKRPRLLVAPGSPPERQGAVGPCQGAAAGSTCPGGSSSMGGNGRGSGGVGDVPLAGACTVDGSTSSGQAVGGVLLSQSVVPGIVGRVAVSAWQRPRRLLGPSSPPPCRGAVGYLGVAVGDPGPGSITSGSGAMGRGGGGGLPLAGVGAVGGGANGGHAVGVLSRQPVVLGGVGAVAWTRPRLLVAPGSPPQLLCAAGASRGATADGRW